MPRKGKQPRSSRPLNARQRAFVHAFCGPSKGNATDAAKRAGYSGNDVVLASVGSKLLRVSKVLEAIAAMNAKVEKRAIKSSREVQEFLSRIVDDDPELSEHELEFDMQGNPLVDPRKMTEDVRELIESYARQQDIEVELDAAGRSRRRRGVPFAAIPPGLDVFFRRRTKTSERRAAAMDLLRAKGELIENVQVKREGSVHEYLGQLLKKASPSTAAEMLQLMRAGRGEANG